MYSVAQHEVPLSRIHALQVDLHQQEVEGPECATIQWCAAVGRRTTAAMLAGADWRVGGAGAGRCGAGAEVAGAPADLPAGMQGPL